MAKTVTPLQPTTRRCLREDKVNALANSGTFIRLQTGMIVLFGYRQAIPVGNQARFATKMLALAAIPQGFVFHFLVDKEKMVLDYDFWVLRARDHKNGIWNRG